MNFEKIYIKKTHVAIFKHTEFVISLIYYVLKKLMSFL